MALRHRTRAYWQRRTQERVTTVEAAAVPHIQKVNGVYNAAKRDMIHQMQAIYLSYYTSQGWDTTKLRQIAPTGDINRFKRELKASGLYTKLPARYSGRLTRLELLYGQMWQVSKQAGAKHLEIATAAHEATIRESYYISVYNVSKGIAKTPAFTTLNTATTNKILNSKFYGKNYSQRIWTNTNVLAETLQKELARAMLTGESTTKTSQRIRKRFDVSRYNAERLMRTETNYFENRASNDAHRSMGLDEWQWLATLDSRTDEDCAERDHKYYHNDDELPPLHSNCRCTQVPAIPPQYDPEVRIARGADGKNYYVPNMSYEQWKSAYVD